MKMEKNVQDVGVDKKHASWSYVRIARPNAATVLLLHAVGLDLTYWGDLIERLRSTYDIVAVDLPGHGFSPPPPSDWSFAAAAEGVADLLDQLGIESAHVIGLSFGGMIAQQLAVSQPNRVRSLTLLATAASFTDEARAGMVDHANAVETGGMRAVVSLVPYWLADSTASNRPDIVDRISKSVLQMDPRVYAAFWRMIASFDLLDALPTIEAPTHVLVGDGDVNTPVSSAEMIAAAIPRGGMTIVRDCSHLLSLDDPDASGAAIQKWLADV